MRRLVLAGLGTVSSLVLILAYPTSHPEAASAGSLVDGSPSQVAADGSVAVPDATATATADDDADHADHADDDADDDADDADDRATADGADTSSPATPSAGRTGTSTTGTYTGDAVQTRWGVVQVQITVTNGRVTAAEAIRHPDANHRDQEINAYALPILNAEAVAAQSATIDAVSGATVTSQGYVSSLQSALDAARL